MKKISLFLFLLLPIISYSQDLHILKSKFIPNNDTVFVFKPDNYDQTKKYATVFLLHGWDSNYKQWNEITDLQSYANLYNFIIVCPDGFKDSWYLNSPLFKTWQYESFFFTNLIPFINANYSINDSSVFITGLSMGGHGALHLFIKKPEIFKAAGSTSGVMDLEARKINFGLKRLLGNHESNQVNWQKNSVMINIAKLQGTEKHIFIDCGLSDPFFTMNKNFVDKAIELSIPISFLFSQGNHSTTYWNKSIAQQLAYFYKLCQN